MYSGSGGLLLFVVVSRRTAPSRSEAVVSETIGLEFSPHGHSDLQPQTSLKPFGRKSQQFMTATSKDGQMTESHPTYPSEGLRFVPFPANALLHLSYILPTAWKDDCLHHEHPSMNS
ncbi:hypothetical protein BU16DRAFT_199290 [Lophium mytilinum]|uniref:Uncharacterized protein n=1 Tax=Lophium mytilinum TaxID=390894 RepID=A0A6A6RAP5_9PEZI|nr:hypothetical protein BU16DRAFT_199290 [Lophium mytilinum]